MNMATDDESSLLLDGSNGSSKNKIISIESTADGDITTVEERTTSTTTREHFNDSDTSAAASDSIRTFKNHLRDSWDEGFDMDNDHPPDSIIDGLDNAPNSCTRRSSSSQHQHHRSSSRHRKNLSVQFLEFSISGDDINDAQQQQQRRGSGKETIEGSASYYFNPPSPSSRNNNELNLTMGGMESNHKSSDNTDNAEEVQVGVDMKSKSNNDTAAEFKNALQASCNIRNSVKFLDDAHDPMMFEECEEKEEQDQQQQLQLSDEQGGKRPSQSLEGNKETIGVVDSSNTILTAAVDALEPPACASAPAPAPASAPTPAPTPSTSSASTTSMSREKHILPQLPSHESTPETNAISVDHDMIRPLRLGSDSPISPSYSTSSYASEHADIIVPIPFRPSGSNSSIVGGSGGSGGNRKHRREFSGKSNPALIHRRVNTQGDKCAPPGEDVFKGGQQQEIQSQHDHPLSPPTEATPSCTYSQQQPQLQQPQLQQPPPPPPPLQQPQAQYPPQYQYGTPPTHHPYQQHLPPQMPYHNHGTQTPPTYYNASPASDSGFNYTAHHTSSSPVVSGYPPPQELPPQHASPYQYPAQQTSPSGYPPSDQVPQQLPQYQYPAHQSSPVVSGYPPPPVQPPQQASYPNPGHQTPPLTLSYPPPQGQPPQQASPYHSQHPAHQTSPVVSGYPPAPPPAQPLQQAPVYHNQYPAHQTSPIVSGYLPPHEQSPKPAPSTFQYSAHQTSPVLPGYPPMQEQSPKPAPSTYQYPAHQTSPLVSGYPPPQSQMASLALSSPHNQYSAHQTSSTVAEYPPPQAQPPLQTIEPPPILTQPSLEENHSRSRANSQEQPREKLFIPFPNNEKGSLLVKASPKGHRKEPSYNPLPFIDTNERNSIGSFLATTTLFDDDLSDKGEDYASAAEEGDADRHSRNNSLNSLAVSRLEQFVDKQSKEVDASAGLRSYRPPPPPPVQIPNPSDGYSMLSTSPVVSHVMARQSPTGSLPGYSHPPLHPPPPPPPLQHPNTSDGYPMLSTSPVISSTMAYQPRPPGSSPGHPPTPPAYPHPPTPPAYPHCATPPQSSWHPPHQQQSPTYHTMYHQSPQQHQMMEYHQTPPYQQHPPPHHVMVQHHNNMSPYSNVPPPPAGAYTHDFHPQQPMICPPTARSTGESSQSSGGSKKENKSRRKCTVPDCPNRVVQGGLCIAHGAKRKICSVEGCTKNVKKLGLCSTHGPARKRCEYEGCTKVAVKSGRCIAHGAKKKGCSHIDCEKQAIFGGMCKRHYDEANGNVKSRTPLKTTASEDDIDIDDDDNDDISSDEQADPKDAHQANQKGDGGRGHKQHQRGLSLFHDSELMNTIINNGVPPMENDGLHGLSILNDTGDLEATPSNLKE